MATVNFLPLDDHVLIERVAPVSETEGGIVLPDSAQDVQTRGTVVAVGLGRVAANGSRVSMTVVPGDLVVFGKYGGTQIEVDAVEYVIVREVELLGVLLNHDG